MASHRESARGHHLRQLHHRRLWTRVNTDPGARVADHDGILHHRRCAPGGVDHAQGGDDVGARRRRVCRARDRLRGERSSGAGDEPDRRLGGVGRRLPAGRGGAPLPPRLRRCRRHVCHALAGAVERPLRRGVARERAAASAARPGAAANAQAAVAPALPVQHAQCDHRAHPSRAGARRAHGGRTERAPAHLAGKRGGAGDHGGTRGRGTRALRGDPTGALPGASHREDGHRSRHAAGAGAQPDSAAAGGERDPARHRPTRVGRGGRGDRHALAARDW